MLRKLIVTAILVCCASMAYATSHTHGDQGTQPATQTAPPCPMMKEGAPAMPPCSKEAMEQCAKCPHAKDCKHHKDCMEMKKECADKPAPPAHSH